MKINYAWRAFCLAAIVAITTQSGNAQGPRGKEFGFGIILGDPLGLTGKYWVSNENAMVFDFGASYFGSPRIQFDYVWHLDVFKSQIVKLYAGPGLGLGFGRPGYSVWYIDNRGRERWYYRDSGLGVAVRVMVGVNIIPRATPLEIFLELGPNIGIVPGFGAALDAAVGIRFYP